MKWEKNIGAPDRILRFFIALALLGYAYWKSSWIALGLSGFVFLEVFLSWCVLFQIFGKNSCKIQK